MKNTGLICITSVFKYICKTGHFINFKLNYVVIIYVSAKGDGTIFMCLDCGRPNPKVWPDHNPDEENSDILVFD